MARIALRSIRATDSVSRNRVILRCEPRLRRASKDDDAPEAQTRNPYPPESRTGRWIPGSRFARPGMTTHFFTSPRSYGERSDCAAIRVRGYFLESRAIAYVEIAPLTPTLSPAKGRSRPSSTGYAGRGSDGASFTSPRSYGERSRAKASG